MIRENLHDSPSQIRSDDVAVDPAARYNIGVSEKFPVHIPTFLQRNDGDPAIKVSHLSLRQALNFTFLDQNFFSKLRGHLLPRIQASLQQEVDSLPDTSFNNTPLNTGSPAILGESARDSVYLKRDCIYDHKVVRFNFTTYDVRRGADVVKPGTSRCNIMLLADRADGSNISELHHFLYARILGAYHANVIYTGPGMRDYEARRFDFLWVRWYEVINPASSGWSNSTFDAVCFPPMHEDTSFGFVDPNDVLRGCHILPAFANGKRNETGIDISRCAKDSKDYKMYYIGRCVAMLCQAFL
jgi:hypothetical protein